MSRRKKETSESQDTFAGPDLCEVKRNNTLPPRLKTKLQRIMAAWCANEGPLTPELKTQMRDVGIELLDYYDNSMADLFVILHYIQRLVHDNARLLESLKKKQ